MKVGFDNALRIQGCEIVNYLLEKSRVVQQSSNERNYHIFYQLIAGADATMKSKYYLRNPAEYAYLNQSGCYKIDGVDDAAEFRDVIEAMKTLQFSASTIDSILKVISAILLLGNIEFEALTAGDNESSKIKMSSQEVLLKCAELLGAEQTTFTYSLTSKRVQMGRGSVVSMKLSVSQANDSRDTLSKSLYSYLFDWTIRAVNQTLKTGEPPYSIGILDIFGFEVFELNSFEQLCINYANEKLQFHFNEVIFSEETMMYQEEGIPLEHISFEDNGECVNLIEGKPYGLLSLLEEECSLGNATDLTYINKCEKTFSSGKQAANKYFIKNKVKPECFSVVHFAGAVEYNITNFLDKNRDTMSQTSKEVMLSSQLTLVQELFQDPSASEGGSAGAAGPQRGGGKGSKSSASQSKSTLGGQFRNQLIGLITNLKQTEPHFIRCVKPNHQKVGGIFDGHLALRQLRYAGLFEAIRIRKSGFAYRSPFTFFANTYHILVEGLSIQKKKRNLSDAQVCTAILEYLTKTDKLKRHEWHVGQKSKVFLKTNQDRMILERERISKVVQYAVKIQKGIRLFLKRLVTMKEQILLQREMKKHEEILLKQSRAVAVIQKYWRRKSVQLLMQSMSGFIELRRAIAKKEMHKIRNILWKIEAQLPPDIRRDLLASSIAQQNQKASPTKPTPQHGKASVAHKPAVVNPNRDVIWSMFTNEIKIAKVMLKLIEVQDQLITDLSVAIDQQHARELNRLILKAERLEMNQHPLVIEAKEMILSLFRKQKVVKVLIEFLRNEDEYHEQIIHYIEEAKILKVDDDFLQKVITVYENAGPRLKIRNRLRHHIEVMNRYGIEQACLEVLQVRKNHSKFAESELRAARMMLRLMHFDQELYPTSNTTNGQNYHDAEDDKEAANGVGNHHHAMVDISELGDDAGGNDEKKTVEGALLWSCRTLSSPSGAKLTPELIEICNAITEATIPAIAKMHKQRLQQVIGGNIHQVYAVIRYYKWTKTICTWKYPEIQEAKSESRKDPIFVARGGDGNKMSTANMPQETPEKKGLSAIFGGNASSNSNKLNNTTTLQGNKLSKTAATRGGQQDGQQYFGDDGDNNSAYNDDARPEEFFGMDFQQARGNPFIIRFLHQDFDLFAQSITTGEMEAAISNVSLPQSIQETLRNLDNLNNIDVNIILPNGAKFNKTVNRQVPADTYIDPTTTMKSSTTTGNKSNNHNTLKSTLSTAATPLMKSSNSTDDLNDTLNTTQMSDLNSSKVRPSSPRLQSTTDSQFLHFKQQINRRKSFLPQTPFKDYETMQENNIEKVLYVSR